MKKQRWFRKYPRLTLFIVVVTGSLMALFGFEGFLYLFLRFPVLSAYVPYFKPTSVYYTYDRNIIQFMPSCSVYDSQLTYLMKPGECEHCNREFCNRYRINHMGLRDDESSLHYPKVIILGDSYAMGWGVNQDETFAQVIEHQTGLMTLNAGISSYGTAREMLLLERLDTSEMIYLVIQYSNNDCEENMQYVRNHFNLNIMPREEYELLCMQHMNRKRYAPLIFTSAFLNVVKDFLKRNFYPQTPVAKVVRAELPSFSFRETIQSYTPITPEEGAEFFLKILSNYDFRGVRLIVLNLAHYTLDTRTFLGHVADMKQNSEYPSFIRQMKLIDASSFLEKADYYVIDDHLNASGHRKVAHAIIEAMN